jgi:hypothetical protein
MEEQNNSIAHEARRHHHRGKEAKNLPSRRTTNQKKNFISQENKSFSL